MQNKTKQRQRVTKNMMRELEYHHSWRQSHISSEEVDDRYQSGELLVAANILTELAANRAKQRDLLVAAQAIIDARNGTWDYNNGNYYEAGYPPLSPTPPPTWPLTTADWPTDGSQNSLVQKANGLMIAEMERINRAQQHLWRYNFNALDDEGRELEAKRKEVNDKRSRRAFNRRAQEGQSAIAIDNGVLSGQTPIVTYNATMGNAIDFSHIQPQTISDYDESDPYSDTYIEADDDYN